MSCGFEIDEEILGPCRNPNALIVRRLKLTTQVNRKIIKNGGDYAFSRIATHRG